MAARLQSVRRLVLIGPGARALVQHEIPIIALAAIALESLTPSTALSL